MPSLKGSGRAAAPRILKGTAVSRGVGAGTCIRLHGAHHQFLRLKLDTGSIRTEIDRVRDIFETAAGQLDRLAKAKHRDGSDARAEILEAQLMMLSHPSLLRQIEGVITTERVNAEWAVRKVTDEIADGFLRTHEPVFRDRALDLRDIRERLLSCLVGGGEKLADAVEGRVLVARELLPSTLIDLADHPPAAIATEHGGWTSHSFIVAREMGIPAVAGIVDIFRRVPRGSTVTVDGYSGEITIGSQNIARAPASSKASTGSRAASSVTAAASPTAVTLDGRVITLLANADSPETYARARSIGITGIGLSRSDLLVDRLGAIPDEPTQTAAYRDLIDAADGEVLRIRTFDLGSDRFYDRGAALEKNPALGLRGIRYTLEHRKILNTQIRALAAAAGKRRVDIVLPMISDVSEVLTVRRIIKTQVTKLRREGLEVATPGLGAMIEIPSAVFVAEALACECEFLCVGTNDLIQYLTAADRDNDAVAAWYRSLHPAVLRSLEMIMTAARECGRSVTICGEMAGSPYYIPILVGLGVTELSMNVASIEAARTVIAGIAFGEARDLVRSILRLNTAEAVEKAVADAAARNWKHLFPPDFAFA